MKTILQNIVQNTFISTVLFFTLGLINGEPSAYGWERLPSGVTNDLYDLSFPTPCTGWVVGGAPYIGGDGIILKTTDSGASWVPQAIPSFSEPGMISGEPFLYGIHCANELVCFASGSSGVVLKTVNGGEEWTSTILEDELGPGDGFRPTLSDIHVVDAAASTVVAVGSPHMIFRTINGGDSWSQIPAPEGVESNFTKVFFVNETTGWIIGLGGTVLKSMDAGESWEVQAADISSGFFDVFSLDGSQVWASGAPWYVHKSEDGGESWDPYETGWAVTFWGLYFVNELEGWMVGGGGVILKSTDGGLSWSDEGADADSGTGEILREIQCLDSSPCFVVGDEGTILRRLEGEGPSECPIARPDLTVLSGASLACSATSDFHYIVVVRNEGEADSGPFSALIESIDSGGNAIGTPATHSAPALAADGSLAFDNVVSPDFFNPSENTSVTLRITVDALDEVIESDETNNVQIQTTPCSRPAEKAKWKKKKWKFKKK